MSGRTQYENDLVDALESLRDKFPAWTETIVINGVGAQASYEDFGEGWTETLKSPEGYLGKVVSVHIYGIAETFACDAGGARVDVGTSEDSDLYYVGGGAADGAAAATPQHPEGTVRGLIPSDSDFLVTGVQCLDSGTAAGRARVSLTIEWYTE